MYLRRVWSGRKVLVIVAFIFVQLEGRLDEMRIRQPSDILQIIVRESEYAGLGEDQRSDQNRSRHIQQFVKYRSFLDVKPSPPAGPLCGSSLLH